MHAQRCFSEMKKVGRIGAEYVILFVLSSWPDLSDDRTSLLLDCFMECRRRKIERAVVQ